jgi:hypothetical protein
MRGTVRKISLPRRLIADLMHASICVPFVSLARPLNVRELVAARALAANPPGWAAIFVKAFSVVARDEPVLRTLYAKWPWPQLYELPRSVGMVAIARIVDGEDCVLPEKVAGPDALPLTEIEALIRHAKQAPIAEVRMFKKAMLAARLPLLLRRLAWSIGLNFGRLRGDFGGGLRRGGASGAQPGTVYPQLRRSGAGSDHRCRAPLGSPHYRRGGHRQGPESPGTGAEH